MDDHLHIGDIDDENYSLYGKLADGTPIYKYSPPPPPDPAIIKEQQEEKRRVIDDYNKTVELNKTDTSKFLQLFNEENEKEKNRKQYLTDVKNNKVDSSIRKPTVDHQNVLDYLYKKDDNKIFINETTDNTDNYLDLFYREEQVDELKALKEQKAQEEKQRHIDEEDSRRKASAKIYEDYIVQLDEQERQIVKEYEAIVEHKECKLHEEYNEMLKSVELEDFYSDSSDFTIKPHIETRTVTVTNKKSKRSMTFHYLGELKSAEREGHKLRIYSIVRGDKEYGVIKESYTYVTHRHMTYDLRDGKVIKRDTFIVSKVDPESITDKDPDLYYEGWSTQTRVLSSLGEYTYRETNPGTHDISLDLIDVVVDNVPTRIVPTEFIIEVFGAGGAGLSGIADTEAQGTGGGGGSYARKTYHISPFQTYPINARVSIGNGNWPGFSPTGGNTIAVSNDTRWNNNIYLAEKDTVFVFENFVQSDLSVASLSTIAGGGSDGNNAFVGTASGGGYPGKPFGTYDVGFWGSGNKPWSTMQYFLSGLPGASEFDWTNTVLFGTNNYGVAHNGALSDSHGGGSNDPNVASTFNVGMSSGKTATASNNSTSGHSPGGGGGAGYSSGSNTVFVEDPGEGEGGSYTEVWHSYKGFVSGSPGGHGEWRLTVTKGLINRQAYS